MPEWDYRIRAYYPPNRGGGLAIETMHVGEASRDVEISVFKERMRKGDIAYIDIVDLHRPFDGVQTIYPTNR